MTLNGESYRYLDLNKGGLEYVLTYNNTENEMLHKCRLLWSLSENNNVLPLNVLTVESFVFRHDLNLVKPCFELILSKSKKIEFKDTLDLKGIFEQKPTPTAEEAMAKLKTNRPQLN